jgi:hypothetical protein
VGGLPRHTAEERQNGAKNEHGLRQKMDPHFRFLFLFFLVLGDDFLCACVRA